MSKYAVKISEQGQITLPKALRDRIRAKSGERVILVVDDNNISKIIVSKNYPIESYFGAFKSTISGGMDAAGFVRKMRDEDIKKREMSH